MRAPCRRPLSAGVRLEPRERMKHRVAILGVILVVACVSRSFDVRFAEVQPGYSRARVLDALGSPLSKAQDRLPKPPFWGPIEALDGVIEPGASFESWLYRHDRQDYVVFFSGRPKVPKDQWSVIGKTKYPTGAVFEQAPK